MKLVYTLVLMLPIMAVGQKNLDFKSSSELIREGLEWYEKEDYYKAIQEFRKVNINDTNYTDAQYEMAMSYIGMEEYKSAQDVLNDLLAFDVRYEAKHLIYSLLGTAYDNDKQPEKSIEVYTEGIRLYPMQSTLYYNRAMTYRNIGEDQKAIDDLKQAIQCNAYHANSHLQLGIMAVNKGMYSQGTMSLATYLILQPNGERTQDVIQLFEAIANGSYEPEKPQEPAEGEDNYEELNLFYKNRIALEKKYKVKFTIPTSYARQLHLVLKNAQYEKDNQDFWNQHYMPFLKAVWDANKLDQLVMLTLISLDNAAVQKKLKPKVSQIKDFISWAQVQFKEKNSSRYMEFEGTKQWVYAEYEPKYLSAIGKTKEDGTPVGLFHYFHPNGSKKMHAYFDEKGEPTGTWEVFNMYNGNIERRIEFGSSTTDKTVSEFYYSGELAGKYHLLNGKTEDTIFTYYRNGMLKEKYAVKGGVKQGSYRGYYPNGALEYDVVYKDNEIDGSFLSYHLNGQKEREYTATLGQVNGKYTEYYPNGQLSEDYMYQKNMYNGPYTLYFPDGTIRAKGTYKEGKPVGELNEYFSNGVLSSTAQLDENGKQNGTSTYYDIDGKKYHELQFSKGDLTRISFIDKAGNMTELAAKKGKKTDYMLNHPDGSKHIRGQLTDDKREGRWEYFDRYGNLELVENFRLGQIVDTVYAYFSNGQLKSVTVYEDGQRNGMYLEYNIFGQLTEEGFFSNGYYDRDWYSYHSDGSPASEYFFVEGEKNGIQKTYCVNGKLQSWEEYDMGRVISHVFLDTNEQVVDEYGEYNGTVELHNPINSFVNFRAEYKNGNADGPIIWLRPNGATETEGKYVNSERNGTWKWYHLNGKQSKQLTYVSGAEEGSAKSWFANGNLANEYQYVGGNLQGPFKTYHENGKMSTSGTNLNDERHGKVTYYSPQGAVFLIRNYDQGVITSYTYLDGTGKEVTPVPLDKNELKFVTYYQNGNKANEHTRKNGLIEGTYISYHENGKKWEEEAYLHSEGHGKFYEYNEAGVKISETDYSYGDIHGKEILYYANGKIKSERTFVFGTLHGPAKEYAPDGKVTSIIHYYNNEIVSMQTF